MTDIEKVQKAIDERFLMKCQREKLVKANKAHTCSGCSQKIEKGQMYRKYEAALYGYNEHNDLPNFVFTKTCIPCEMKWIFY